MDETKEQLKLLIDFFTGSFKSSRLASSEDTSAGDSTASPPPKPPSPITRQDINLIIKSLELCKKNFSHFSNAEKSYLLPLMTLCGHVLLSDAHLIPRSSLATVSDLLIYILQFILNELSTYSDDEANFSEFNAVYYRKLREISNLSLDSEEYYRYLLKYRITKFLNYMLIGDNDKYAKSFFTDKELGNLCQMLCLKPQPDSLRCHSSSSTPTASAEETPTTPRSFAIATPATPTASSTSSTKRIRLTQPPGSLDRSSKEEFFDQLLTPFIVTSTTPHGSRLPQTLTVPAHHSLLSANVHSLDSSSMEDSPNSATSKQSGGSHMGHAGVLTVPALSNKSHAAQIKSYLISHNQMYFQYAGGANILLNLINSYTLLRPYILHLAAIEEGANLRFVKLDAANFDLICDRIASDIDLVAAIFELNRLLEPLSCDRISKMIVTVQACLYACLTIISHVNSDSAQAAQEAAAAAASSSASAGSTGAAATCTSSLKQSYDLERTIAEIVANSLTLYSSLFDIFRQSNRVAGQICQNAHMFTAWLLFSGLQLILQSNRTTANNPKRMGAAALCNPMAKHALKLMAALLDDLHLEFGDQNTILEEADENSNDSMELNFLKKFSFTCPTSPAQPQKEGNGSTPLSPSASQTGLGSGSGPTAKATFKYNKFGHYSAWQRIEMIVSSQLNIIQLLFSYLSTGYRRACLIRSSSLASAEEGPSSANVDEAMATGDEADYSNIAEKYFVQLMDVAGVESKDTDDSLYSMFVESYSGQADQMAADAETKRAAAAAANTAAQTELHCRDADSHYELVIAILDHLNYYFICSKIDALQAFFKQMLTDAQLIVLAHIIQDLDFELENLSTKVSSALTKTFYKFSGSLTSLMHNLIAMQILTEEQQNSLLAYLGFKPSPESESSWQLYHGAKSLAILAQVILLRQQKEKEDIKLDLNSITIQIWRGFINQLKSCSLKWKGDTSLFNEECPIYYEDLNVEHAQLMLFLFHNLKLLQRKHVFYLVGLALHEISTELNSTAKRTVSAAQILFIGRLLHLFEYMCKNLYDTPAYLFEQINRNLLHQAVPESVETSESTEELNKIELEECLRSEKSLDSLRSILFFVDKKLELNYFNYIIANKDGLSGGCGGASSPLGSSNSSFNSSSLTASSTAANAAASTTASTTGAMAGTAPGCPSNSVNTSLYLQEFIIHPRWYHLMDVSYLFQRNSSSISFVPKLDGMACNFMLAGFSSSLSYEQFYNSLLNLFQFLGHQYDVDLRTNSDNTIASPDLNAKPPRYPQLGAFGLCCLDYTFQTMWRLINQLPPTLQSFSDIIEKVNSKNYEADGKLDAARIINMCIWIPRFECRAVYIWIRELLAKVNNSAISAAAAAQQQQQQAMETGDGSTATPKATAPNLDEIIAELMTKFNSLQYNYSLFKTIIRTFFHFKVSNSKLSSLLSTHSSDHLFTLPNVQFPKFFTLLAVDLYTERVMLLIKHEYLQSSGKAKTEKMNSISLHGKGDILTAANAKSLSSGSQELIFEKYLPQMIGLFAKLYNDVNTILVYDGSLAKKRSPTADLKYLFYRSLVNICSTNCFDSSLTDISANIVDFLPHTVLLKIDQWNRIYATVERSPVETQLHELMSAGFPMEVPLVEVQSEAGNRCSPAKMASSSMATYVNHFSTFLNEKYSLTDFPMVNAVDTGAGNIAWIKLKQFWFKLFKFTESIYWTKSYYQHSDPFVVQLLSMQLNLVASSLTHNIADPTEKNASISNSSQILSKTFDLKSDSNEVYCSALYPQFIRNAFFILTILKNGSFAELAEEDQLKFQKVHQDCANEFFVFFSKILKKSSGKVAFEEFLCDTTPTTPTATATPMNTTASSSFSFLDLIEVASHPFSTSAYGINLLKLIKTLLSQADKYPDDISIIRLCSGLSSALAEHPSRVSFLFNWFHMILFHRKHEDKTLPQLELILPSSSSSLTDPQSPQSPKSSIVFVDDSANNEIYLLYKFVCYVIKDTSRFDEVVLASIAEALLPNARKLLSQTLFDSGNFLSFSGLFTCLVFLMSAAGNSDQFIQSFGKPSGHLKLIDEVVSWLALSKDYLSKKEVIRKIEKNVSYGRHQFILESCYQMLSYLSDIFCALEYKFVYLKSRKALSTDNEDEKSLKLTAALALSSLSRGIFIDDDFDNDHLMERGGGSVTDEEDFDDDEDEDLCDKLCTFTVTQKEFINQHWYHCHTCKMQDGVGVCTVCAQVCHKGHDVTYSKHGSFFCDCGANEEGTCRALVKRPPTKKSKAKKKANAPGSSKDTKSKSGAGGGALSEKKKLMRISKYWYNTLYSTDFNQWKLSDNYKFSRAKFNNQIITENYERFGLKYEHFENFINLLMTFVSPIADTVLTLVEYFVPTLEDFYYQHSELGFLSTIRKEFGLLHSGSVTGISTPLSLEKCEQMLTPIKCSQDAIFENVQINNESQAVRNLSLITGAIVRRSSMLVLGASSSFNATSSNVNPCLLLVAHDKNRISVVQLNLLLSQVYSGTRRKLNPKKLAAITFPFSVMTLAHNPMNDELIAVCGLKDCHVLSLARSGSVTGHYSLFMTLDTNNYIIKAVWLPNSQTELAIVTIDFIKVYDLSREDRDTPIYNFVIPSRKIRDMTFFSCEENGQLKRYALIFSSRGQIYAQELNVDSMCSPGGADTSFYLTTILNVDFPDSWSPSYQQTVVSFSIYYSHLMQMLFVSYLSGESFCAPFTLANIYHQQINNVTSLELMPRLSRSTTDDAPTSGQQATYTEQPPLLHWTEVLTHPGLIFALTMNSNYPVCFMIKPNTVQIQELKQQKRKVIDFVAISCTSSAVRDSITSLGMTPEKLTTMITLCDDGSLRFHKVCNEHTNYWLRPNFLSLEDNTQSVVRKAKQLSERLKAPSAPTEPTASSRTPKFPVDYFEKCTYMNDIEFGGADILEVYNTQQIKNRLNSANMYVACTKPNGFSMTVTQTSQASGLVMAGVRINLGVCDPARAPTAIEIFGRTRQVAINRHRWFDIPFTRAEIAQVAESKTFTIRFAPSGDINNVTIVDNIRVYGKQRDSLGLYVEDSDAGAPDSNAASVATSSQAATEEMYSEPNYLRGAGTISVRGGSSGGSKSPLAKLKVLLYSPTITDDEIISAATSTHQGIFVLNRLIGNCLDVLESSFSFFKSLAEQASSATAMQSASADTSVMALAAKDLMHSPDYQQKADTALSIASKLLTISMSDRLDRSVCMLLAKLLPSRSAYDEHRDEVIFENSIENMKQLAFDDIIVFYYNLALFREMVAERPRNFVRFTGKYFASNATDVAASSIQFSSYLSELFWRLYTQRPINELLAPVTKVSLYANLESTVDSLVFLFYSSMVASLSVSSVSQADGTISEGQLANIRKTAALIVQLLCCPDPQISYSAKKALSRILLLNSNRYFETKTKPSSKQSSAKSSSGGVRERRHSARQPAKPAPPAPSPASGEASSSSSSASAVLRRQGAQRHRPGRGGPIVGSVSAAPRPARRGDPYGIHGGPAGSSNQGGHGHAADNADAMLLGLEQAAGVRPGANVFERVSASLLGGDLETYRTLLLNMPVLGDDFDEEVYINDLISLNIGAGGAPAPGQDEIDGDEDDEDDDEDDDLELAINAAQANRDANIAAPPPLFPMMDAFAPAEAEDGAPGADNLLEAEDEANDDDDDDDEDEEEDEEDYEAMDEAEDAMMELAIALSLQEAGGGAGGQGGQGAPGDGAAGGAGANRGLAANAASLQAFRFLRDLNHDLGGNVGNAEVAEMNAPPRRREPRPLPSVAESNQSNDPSAQSAQNAGQQQQQQQQADYVMLHSESDEDDEELFDDEMKLADATVESIDIEEDDDDEEDLNSLDTSVGSAHSTKSRSKSNESLKPALRHSTSQQDDKTASAAVPTTPPVSKTTTTATPSCTRHRKRQRKMITSQFCLSLLKQMSTSVDAITRLDGVQSIPFLQVLIMLADFKYHDGDQKEFGQVFSQLVQNLLNQMLTEKSTTPSVVVVQESSEAQLSSSSSSKRRPVAFKQRIDRADENEVFIVIMRLFSVFLARFKHYPTLYLPGLLSKDANLTELWEKQSGAGTSTSAPTTPSIIPVPSGSSSSGPLSATPSSSSKAVTFDEQSITRSKEAAAKERLSQASYSLLLTATQLVNSNGPLLNYCLSLLQHLLRYHWRPLHSTESEDAEKNKAVVHGETIVYHSKKPIKIRPHLNFIPYDLKPFFMIAQQNYLTGPLSAAAEAAASSTDPSTTLNSAIFSNNVFDKYSELLTEMCLRLPYQLKKLIVTWHQQHAAQSGPDTPKPTLNVEFDSSWIEVLCEYMMLPSVTAYTRKQVRKLLAYLCGSKERYRQVRDYYSIKTHLRAVRRTIVKHFFDANSSVYALKLEDLDLTEDDLEDEEQLDELIDVIITNTFLTSEDQASQMMSGEQHRLLNLPYAQLIGLVDDLKACLEISTARVLNWQRLCRRELRILPFLFRISLLFGEGVSTIILQLISLALFTEAKTSAAAKEGTDGSTAANNYILNESKLQASTSEAAAASTSTSAPKSPSAAEQNMSALCRYVFAVLDRSLLGQFIRYFLLESNSTQHRWAAHSLLYHFYQALQPRQQEQLLALFWKLWPSLACYGKRGSQFVDLLGYFTLNTNRSSGSDNQASPRIIEMERHYAESAIGLLKYQNAVLTKHPNANIYNSLQSLLEFNGFYLETEPCLVCNNPEVNFVPVKLSSIKLDSRFTTNTHIVKMIGSHTISKIAVKISELKKTKMVKTLSIYYNNRYVQSVVELKNKSTTWHKAKKVTLSPSQVEVKIDFALPIVACNLMIEYSNFYESSHSSTETLQCPRCSSVVPANPGVCTNCGENVFQCHKCRAINYDEKDPFLCNSCGFCKYAKFDYVLTARYTATAVETIENEEDRAKAVTTINTLLDKADRLYKLILTIRPSLEQLLLCSQDYNSTVYCLTDGADAATANATGGSSVAAAASAAASSAAASGIPASAASSSTFHVNRYIQQLAGRYCNDCRMHFEELSKIVQKVLYTRKELVDYDNRQNGNRNNYDDLKRMIQERRQATKLLSVSNTSLSSSSSCTLIESAIPSKSKTARHASLGDDMFGSVEAKKKRLSPEIELLGAGGGGGGIAFENFKSGRCYGCSSATIEHCITLLKALGYTPRYKSILSSSSLFRELIDYNLRLGTGSFRSEIRSLLCLLTRDNPEATEEFNNLLLEKIKLAFQSHYMTSFDFGSIRHEMALLAASFENEDNCWEQRLRCVMKLFLLSLQNKSPAVLEAITLPCLRILYGLIIKPKSEKDKKEGEEAQASVEAAPGHVSSKPATALSFDSLMVNVTVDLAQWLQGDQKTASFASWQQRNLRLMSPAECRTDPAKMAQLEEHLERKYFNRWYYLYQSGRLTSIRSEAFAIRIASSNWIQEVLFNPTSKALRVACRQLLMALFERLTNQQRVLIDLLTSFLDDLCAVGGETGLEFYDLYRSIIFSEYSPAAKAANVCLNKNRHWRYYLALSGLLQHLGELIAAEIARLKQLEEATLSSDFSQGFALRQLVELLQIFMVDDRIRRAHKSSMVGFVLDGYLSLRMLIVQRTKMIDDTQTALLELLELLTTGTKAETINFMKVCIESVRKCSIQDLRTPVFIFERLCSIIYPEEKDADEFFISLEKDPQQEDFLQGRMLGNPYSSKDAGMGPLMRDIKNKICQECELVSLLEDDSGLELLVNGKIISLDLPVKEVYKKLVSEAVAASSVSGASGVSTSSWSSIASGHLNLQSDIAMIDSLSSGFPLSGSSAAPGAGAARGSNVGPTMKITYRIRGLMGDATEEFIESFNSKESVVEDDEKRFELANIMSEAAGLQVMLERLQAIDEINNRSRQLLFVLLKLFGYCTKVVSNRRALISLDLNTVGSMLGIARLFVKSQQPDLLTNPSAPGEPSYFEQLLTLMETLLAEASRENAETYDKFNQQTCGTAEDVKMLLSAVTSFDSVLYSVNVTTLTSKILRIITFLALGNNEKLTTLLDFFKPYFDFDAYDRKSMHLENPEHRFELLCSLLSGIETNKNGDRLKDLLIEEGFVPCTIEYLVRNAPPMKNFLLINSEEWKDFTSRPALKYVLRMLTGLSHGHENTQLLITRDAIPIIHGLEQVLTDSHMATLAENLMDAIKENPSVEAKIQEVRLRTKEEKKRIAMAVREKQLGELGMRANDKGQVMADSQLLKQMEEQLGEEKGLVCSICREGYQFQPQKVLAAYTYTKRCNVDEHEDRKPRKTVGYTTVTHFNIIHVECHMSAVRHARTRDEWASAALQNANTKCNGLLPLWGPQIYESLFAHALARHNSYLQDAIGQRDFAGTNSFLGTIHDLKLLLLRFATESTFSEETGGGGAQSNLYLTPYLAHIALYVMNTTKVVERERTNLETNFMKQPVDKWIESAFAADSAYFWTTMVLLLQPKQFWATNRLYCLKRLILCEHLRHLPAESRNAASLAELAEGEVAYANIKPALMFFAMINLFYTVMFKNAESTDADADWSTTLANYIRHNDQSMLESADKMLDTFENDLLPSASFAEFCDAADLMRGADAISDPDAFLKEALKLPA